MLNIKDIKKQKILVVGDVLIDEYLFSDVSRISPEAPIPILNINQKKSVLGGAANVANNLSKLGVKSSILGYVGSDSNSITIKKLLKNNNIKDYLIKLKNSITILKTRFISKNQQIIRADYEKKFNDKDKRILKKFIKIYKNFNCVIFSDYNKGTLESLPQMIRLCKTKGIRTFIDPKNQDFSKYKNAFAITPNKKEFQATVGQCKNLNEITTKARKVIKKYKIKNVIVTLGSEGMVAVSLKNKYYYNSTKNIDVYDVTGAGDTVISLLALTSSLRLDWNTLINIAGKGAEKVIQKFGTSTLEFKDLDILQNQKKIESNKNLMKKIYELKKENKKIVFTNGCFDILHEGHIKYLERSKKLGDFLIVALNTDKSVKILKGKNRPINSLSSRMNIINSLKPVDLVISFNENTPSKLIKKIKPDIVTKGGDYRSEQLKKEFGKLSKNTKFIIINYLKNNSTTKTIKKIKDF